MRSYFVRHTQKLTIRDADLKNLWDEDRVSGGPGGDHPQLDGHKRRARRPRSQSGRLPAPRLIHPPRPPLASTIFPSPAPHTISPNTVH